MGPVGWTVEIDYKVLIQRVNDLTVGGIQNVGESTTLTGLSLVDMKVKLGVTFHLPTKIQCNSNLIRTQSYLDASCLK